MKVYTRILNSILQHPVKYTSKRKEGKQRGHSRLLVNLDVLIL
jgi:hypothetical protein